MELIGNVLWWSERDQNGIIVDPYGNEFYFDSSVLLLSKNQKISRNTIVTFFYNKSVPDCLCAKGVIVPQPSKRKILEKQYKNELISSI